MHVIIVGCGRVGATIVPDLVEAGHSVCVIDRHREAFRKLGPDFVGTTIVGVGFDRDVLRAAGIERTDGVAVAAVTSGDNSNIVVARVARETFGIEHVIARIYDPKRAVIYERLGITTVASVAWAAARALRKLLPASDLAPVWTDPTATFVMVEHAVPTHLAGRRVDDVEAEVAGKLTLIQRNGIQLLAQPGMLLQEGDRAHLIVADDATDRVAEMWGDAAPEVTA